ncbi:hypothetical protein Vadar_015277 [Vaccinium darrowii]|uniref:Uncharacterized protein n=1 Tax=Vaccinium darrowii TaxID=229202 RepID=A0ACB7YWR6_9ERIC|nr:hypothetical protein Vadar_015277 [Vaccinium darrowii]
MIAENVKTAGQRECKIFKQKWGILKDGTQVAVKKLSAESNQGARESLTEINTISNVRHPNLVELIGWCAEGTKRALVYECLENISLNHALLGRKSRTVKLDWGKRSAICMGTARGLAYLLEELAPHIVHRAIKAIVSGRSSSKANWAWQLYEEGKLLELVDPELEDFSDEEIIRYIKVVAFFCTQAAAIGGH